MEEVKALEGKISSGLKTASKNGKKTLLSCAGIERPYSISITLMPPAYATLTACYNSQKYSARSDSALDINFAFTLEYLVYEVFDDIRLYSKINPAVQPVTVMKMLP